MITTTKIHLLPPPRSTLERRSARLDRRRDMYLEARRLLYRDDLPIPEATLLGLLREAWVCGASAMADELTIEEAGRCLDDGEGGAA